MQIHNIEPVWARDSQILILGSFPSVKSRETRFFYGHPQNRFWKVLSAIYQENLPLTIEEKKAFLLRNKVAVWDVIASCEIEGSKDESITDVLPNDIRPLLKNSEIHKIFCNGNKSYQLYMDLIVEKTGIQPEKLPSTSSANGNYNLEKLITKWSVIKA